MRILGMRGIWNPYYGGHSFVNSLLNELSAFYGHTPVIVRYPFMSALFTGYSERGKRLRAQALLDAYRAGDIVVAFSAGVLLTLCAMRMGAKFGKVFFFGGAAESDAAFPADAYDVIYNVHSNTDKALALGELLPFHPFGDLGRTGYDGPNPNVANFPAHGLDHTGYTEPRQVRRWARFVQDRLHA